MIVLSSLLSLVFLILAIIHLNWAIGNTWGLDNALPSDEHGTRLFTPGRFMTLSVALGLLGFCFFYFINPEPGNPNNWIFDYGRWIIPAVFLLRALGDFKYVGFFKKIRHTNFAKMDTKYYTPLCLAIALCGFAIKLWG